jgi:hypothetical protein
MPNVETLIKAVRTITRLLRDLGAGRASVGSGRTGAVGGEDTAPIRPETDREAVDRVTCHGIQTMTFWIPWAENARNYPQKHMSIRFRPAEAPVLSVEEVAAALRRHVVLSMIFGRHLGAASDPM